MLKLSIDELHDMDATDFALYVESYLSYQREQDDYQLKTLAHFTAHIMVSGGNMKKNTKPNDLTDDLYKSFDELLKDNKPKEELKDEAEAEKEKLRKRFNI